MTWLMQSKILQQSGLTGSRTIPISIPLLTQSASASADFETTIWSPLTATFDAGFPGPGTNVGHLNPYTGLLETHVLLGAWLATDTAVTGGGATVQATAKIRIYNNAGTLVGTAFSLLFNTGTNTVARLPKSLGTAITTLRAASNFPGGIGLRANESITFEWLQSATTGLALPAAVIILDIV